MIDFYVKPATSKTGLDDNRFDLIMHKEMHESRLSLHTSQ